MGSSVLNAVRYHPHKHDCHETSRRMPDPVLGQADVLSEALGRLSRCDAGANGRPPSFGYRVNLNLSAKVLDFVKSGGPKLTVDRTIFELLLAL